MLRGLIAAVGVVAAVGLSGCANDPPPPQPEGILATITTPSRSSSSSATSTSAPSTADGSTAGWYLALGDSLAAGVQPGMADQRTRGYAGPVLAELRKDQPGTALQNLGCPGETTTTMINGRSCPYDKGNQLEEAVDFLAKNKGTTRLITLDIGANNVVSCAKGVTVDTACARTNTAVVSRELGTILAQLHTAAPEVEIVVLSYYDPWLAAWQQGDAGRTAANQSRTVLKNLNDVIRMAAAKVGAKVADVEGAFATSDTSGSPPVNYQRICEWTWMCSQQDIHANDQGYAAMAKAVLEAK
jgi:lysophospholipase L1-like esterase